jgi:uncharacterized protein
MVHKHTNSLINETSPYLLQHAHNPVNWHPWGEAALQKAKSEGKVILVSIGYAACHWCHVMERESFEDEATAEIMNKHFINIKIDREERPDIDHIYMEAVQAIAGNGGWPLNVFLTPDTKPFYGGTYFPPVKAYNRSSWKEVLHGVAQAWRERRTEIEAQADNLTEHIAASANFGNTITGAATAEILFTPADCHTIFDNLMKAADTVWGGFGTAPKFPQTFSINWLLQYQHFTGNKTALDHALLSIDKMLEGGLYDQAGGGFARYSTDAEWLAPHFEKMLYDNALLLITLCDAFAITKKKDYQKAINKTIAFIKREMTHADGGFFAALDADSEGVEGKFYVWSKAEIDAALGKDATIFCEFFNVTEAGNWEETNILRMLIPAADFCSSKGLNLKAFEVQMEHCLGKLMVLRSNRIRPQTDDKILLGWNALAITALCRAAGVLGNKEYAAMAEDNFAFLWKNFKVDAAGVAMYHTFKEGIAKYPAFLDDYAYLIQACIYLQELTSNPDYLLKAREITAYVIDNFSEADTGYFFFTGSAQTDVLVRKKEVHDGAIPSGNSMMAHNLATLGTVFDLPAWLQRAISITNGLLPAVVKHPNSFAIWASLLLNEVVGVNEVVVCGKVYEQQRDALLANYLPATILQCAATENPDFPLLSGKGGQQEAAIYLCRQYSCGVPVLDAATLVAQAAVAQNLTTNTQ